MKNLFLLLSVVITSFTTLTTALKKDSISILCHNGVKNKMVIIGENTGNIELDDYHNTLTTKLSEILKRHYKNINIVQKLPETGKVLVIRNIEPKLIKGEGKTVCKIMYNCEVWENKKQVKKITDTVFQDYIEEDLPADKIMALITYTHKEMIDKIADEAR